MPVSTRKMPVAIAGKNEFVVPNPDGGQPGGFLAIDSGAIVETGALSYLGRDVSAEEVAERFLKSRKNRDRDRAAVLKLIERYLSELQQFKIGTVLGVEYADNGTFVLKLVSRSPVKDRPKRLP